MSIKVEGKVVSVKWSNHIFCTLSFGLVSDMSY